MELNLLTDRTLAALITAANEITSHKVQQLCLTQGDEPNGPMYELAIMLASWDHEIWAGNQLAQELLRAAIAALPRDDPASLSLSTVLARMQ